MKRLLLFTTSFFTFMLYAGNAFSNLPKEIQSLKKAPPKVIRTCCAFGVDIKVEMLPFVKITSITAPDLLGKHKFLGDKREHNGIIYTRHGGFIDIGHLRDIADLTAYMYSLLKENREYGLTDFKLGREGGLKTLTIKPLKGFSDTDIALLAGRIAYDISIWHEISTWFGISSVPMIPEKYSSFSIEDAYSNLLGSYLGMNAVLSMDDYEDVMTENLNKELVRLGCVQTTEDTRNAMEVVKDLWWTDKAKFPSKKIMLKRQFNVLNEVEPLLVNEDDVEDSMYRLTVPQKTSKHLPIEEYYSLNIDCGIKIPVKKVLGRGEVEKRRITQNYFGEFINYAEVVKKP